MFKKNMIYNGEHIRAYSAMYNSDCVFITFNNRGELYPDDKHTYWGANYFNKHEISSIGIVARKANWFPLDEMREIAKVVNIITEGQRVITYGTSMGGYGALKFSKLLNSDLGLGFSPQWSMNPDDIDDYRWGEFKYDPILKGGEAISQADLRGENYIFLDPKEGLDIDHAAVLEQFEGVRKIIVPFSWHGSLYHLTHNGGLKRLLSAAMEAETSSFNKFRGITRFVRKDNFHYHNIKIKSLRDRLIASQHHKLYHELKKITRKLASQEDMLLHAVCLFLDGDSARAQDILNNPSEQGFNAVSTVDIEIILNAYKKYNFEEGIQVLERILTNRRNG